VLRPGNLASVLSLDDCGPSAKGDGCRFGLGSLAGLHALSVVLWRPRSVAGDRNARLSGDKQVARELWKIAQEY
jgi:hypothetical protein